ncbi:MAG: Ig-like domain-containing protein, partial [Pseudomonadota bacterium]
MSQIRKAMKSLLVKILFLMLMMGSTSLFSLLAATLGDFSKVKLSLGPDPQLVEIKLQVEQLGGKILDLTPEGTLFLQIPTTKISSLSEIEGVLSVEDLSAAAAAKAKTVSSLVATEDSTIQKTGLIRDPTVTFPSKENITPNTLSANRALMGASTSLSGATIPTSVDNSLSNAFPPIGDQGNLQSCVAFAAGYYWETYTQAKEHNYDVRHDATKSQICSPAFTYNLYSLGSDEGAVSGNVMDMFNRVGCMSWKNMPYLDTDLTPPSTNLTASQWADALTRRTSMTYTIASLSTTQNNLDALKVHLSNGKLAITAFDVYQNFHDWWNTGTGDKFNNGVFFGNNGAFQGGHAVVIVGYDDSRSYFDNNVNLTKYGALLMANSWGNSKGFFNTSGLGDKGFFWVGYDFFKSSFDAPIYNEDRIGYVPQLYSVTKFNSDARGCLHVSGGLLNNLLAPVWQPEDFLPPKDTALSLVNTSAIQMSLGVDLTDSLSTLANNPYKYFVKLKLGTERSSCRTSTYRGHIDETIFYRYAEGAGPDNYVSMADNSCLYNGASSATCATTIAPGNSMSRYRAAGTAPTVFLSSSILANAKINSSIPLTITFSEAVIGFTSSDLALTNAVVSTFTGQGATYSATLTPQATGWVSVSLPAGMAVAQASGLANQISSTLDWNYDSTRPSVTLAVVGSSDFRDTATVTITFSKAINGFDQNDFVFSGSGQLVNNSLRQLGTTRTSYTALVTALLAGTFTVNIPTNKITDDFGNSNPSSNIITLNHTVDEIGATVSSSYTQATNAPIPFAVTFASAVNGFDQTDLHVTGGTITTSSFVANADSKTFTFTVTPAILGTNSIAISIDQGAGSDQSDANKKTAAASANFTVIYDTTAPSVILSSTAPDNVISSFPVTVTFNESVTGFTANGISITNAAISNFAGTGNTYSFTASPTITSGTITISVNANAAQDQSGNGSSASTSSLTRSIAELIASIQTSYVLPTNAPIPFKITFSSAVTSFDVLKLQIVGGELFSQPTTSNNQEYYFSITPSYSQGQSTLWVSLAAGTASDALGRSSVATSVQAFSVYYDTTIPTVALSSPATATVAGTFTVNVTFSEEVFNFNSTGLTITNANISNLTGTGKIYSFTASPTTLNQQVTINVNANAARDKAGNLNT